MAKSYDARKNVQYVGWYQPHAPVTFDNRVLDMKTGEYSTLPTRTKQEFVAECDINNILKQYKATGMIQHIRANAAQGAYVDLPEPQEFQDSLHVVEQAKDAFATLPSKVRNRFGNDPVQFLEFVADPSNQDELISLGLATDNRPPKSEAPGSTPAPAKEPMVPSDRSKPGAEGSKGG